MPRDCRASASAANLARTAVSRGFRLYHFRGQVARGQPNRAPFFSPQTPSDKREGDLRREEWCKGVHFTSDRESGKVSDRERQNGQTRRITEAKAARLRHRENSYLKPIRVATWGGVLFVSLADNGPSLHEYLAPANDLWEGGFAAPFRFAAVWAEEFPCNWKVVLENSLESYHVPEVHAATFGDMPTEEACSHDLHAGHTSFTNVLRNDWGTRLMNGLARHLGVPVTGKYHHLNVHPHLSFTRLDVYRQIMSLQPTGPQSCRYQSIIYTLRGDRSGLFRWIQAQFLRLAVVHTAKKVFGEDGDVYKSVQKGVSVSPFTGVIGTREERIHYFQDYIVRKCGLLTPSDPADNPAVSLDQRSYTVLP